MSALIGRRAALRWVHLVLGGALLTPFFLLALVVVTTAAPGGGPRHTALLQFAAFTVALPAAAVTALVPVVRVLESAAARALCAGAAGELATAPARSWSARRRTALWFVLHLSLGGVVSGMSLAVPPAVLTLLLDPDNAGLERYFGPHPPALPLAAGLLALPVLVSAGAGAALARTAPHLLGPTPAERLAEAEQRAVVLAQRNRLARELHDSVGHALSAVSLQAAAARRVLDRDPAFAAEALAAIEETARAAVAELDTVLGLLREEEVTGSGGPTLAHLDVLLRQLALTGVTVTTELGPGITDLADLDGTLSREAYRIVQEGLSNVLRHAGPVRADLRIDRREGHLDVELTNPIGAGRPGRPGGGRGLRGLAERADALRGRFTAGPVDSGTAWRLAAELPLDALDGRP
ncbi:histidine kinase [Kitasatospora paracochleata]|uniref:histidine kinase n=1 Tax=Kitasatospora paracochleata TaxID=58354 RepID=A0ABT1J4V1_9ACTN|nr:histidine kinase [Kitasatospora paracochleata]MCP2312460.1 signal transduction histidine kinase [Kitasatospora paracochleata]